MKKLFVAALFSLWSQIAAAGISCSLPFTLVNGVTADATQVMANYNALVACLANAATAGANSDITSLLGLTTPLFPTGGGTQWFVGGTSTNVGNAYTVASLTPNNFTLSSGLFAVFVANATNNGPTTWNINGKGATNVKIHTATGLSNLSGGEIVSGQVTLGFYDGTQFQLIDAAPATGLVQPCTMIDYTGVATPTGYLNADGSLQSRTSFSNLFSCLAYTSVSATTNGTATVTVPNSALFQVGWFVGGNNVTCNSTISSIPGGGTTIIISPAAGASGATTLSIGPYPQGDCSTTFNLPNFRGRLATGVDPLGTTLSSTACPNEGTIGIQCGTTTQTIALANLPTGITSNQNSLAVNVTATANTLSGTAGGSMVAGGAITGPLTPGTFATGLPSSGTINVNVVSNNTSGTPFLLQPVGLVQKAIKF